MSDTINTGSADSMPVSGASCGIKPSKEAIDTGYEVDFSKAKSFLEDETDSPPEEKTL